MMCDELRAVAESVGLAMPQAATLMMGAADTIDRLDAENARLRKFMSDILIYGYDGGFLCSNGVWSCPHFQECFNCPIEEGPEQYVRRGCRWLASARELGIGDVTRVDLYRDGIVHEGKVKRGEEWAEYHQEGAR